MFYMYLNASQYDDILFSFSRLKSSFFHSILVLYVLQKRSLDTFYSNSNNIGFLHVFLWQMLFDLIIHFLV